MNPPKKIRSLLTIPQFNPRTVGVGIDPETLDKNFASIDAKALSASSLTTTFAPTLATLKTENAHIPTLSHFDPPLKPSAVLIALQQLDDEWRVILTVRSTKLKKHSGQIALPGGKVDEADGTAAATAVREAFEEIGLPSNQLQVIGALPTESTGTGFEITPIVAICHGAFTPVLSEFEVSELFTVPLAHFLNPANHTFHSHTWTDEEGTHTRQWYSMPYTDAAGVERFIWGATARVMRNFYLYLHTHIQP